MRDLIDKKIDLVQSMPQMYVFLMFYALILVFWITGKNTINTLPEPSERLFGILGLMFMELELLKWIGKPKLVYRTRIENRRRYNRSEVTEE